MSKPKVYNKHHRCPQSLNGNDSERNISVVCEKQHSSWHSLFQNYTPHRIAAIINSVWLDPGYEFIVRKKGGEPCT